MSRSFQNGAFTANSTFGNVQKLYTASEHIANIKSQTIFRSVYKINCVDDPATYCKLNMLRKKNTDCLSDKNSSNGYEYLTNIARGHALDKNEINNVPSFNHMDLVSGLYSAVDLNNVVTICGGTSECVVTTVVNVSHKPLYLYYRVDPDGELFGNTPCSINNYLNYVVLEE